MKPLTLHAHGKINWTLEVLGKRDDGYHEVRSVMQTFSWPDRLLIWPAGELSLEVQRGTHALRRAARESPDSNLAYRAARMLQQRSGLRLGAQMKLKKGIPVAAGMGGGSSDAAAALRGLRRLWDLQIEDAELRSMAEALGSDAPFFLHGGTAVASGRGELIEEIPDVPTQHLVFGWPKLRRPRPDKTASMYGALQPEHYTDGSRTAALSGRIRHGDGVREEDIFNVFEAVLSDVDPDAAALFERARALELGRPHLAGSGPAFFFAREGYSMDWHRALREGLLSIGARTTPALTWGRSALARCCGRD